MATQAPTGDRAVSRSVVPSSEQRVDGEREFPSPNQARREMSAGFVSTSQTETVSADVPRHDSAVPRPRKLVLQPSEGRSSTTLTRPGSESSTRGKLPGPLTSLITIGSSLAIVLGLFFALAWLMRRSMPKAASRLPAEIVQLLGRTNLGRQPVQLVRCGNKLILLATSPSGITPLTEITDPLEVDRLAGLCQQTQPSSATKAFGQIFQQASRQDSASETAVERLRNLNEFSGNGGVNQLNPRTTNHG